MHVKTSVYFHANTDNTFYTQILNPLQIVSFQWMQKAVSKVWYSSHLWAACFKRDITKLILISITKDCPSLSDAWIQWVMLFIHSTHASNLSRILMSVNFVILSVVCVYFSIKTCEVKKFAFMQWCPYEIKVVDRQSSGLPAYMSRLYLQQLKHFSNQINLRHRLGFTERWLEIPLEQNSRNKGNWRSHLITNMD